jgi:hypothetical protein
MYKNFTISSPLQDDDAVTFTIVGQKDQRGPPSRRPRRARRADGSPANTSSRATRTACSRRRSRRTRASVGANGASQVVPAIVNDSVVYLQARGSVMRDLRYEASASGGLASYKGRDLTVFAGHLFTNKSITRMDYAQIPDSIIWAVSSDGTLLGLTYLTDHEVWGWHHHDTDGTYEDVCVVPEGKIDATYVVVKRTINGVTKRYIERFAARDFTDIATTPFSPTRS